MPGMLQSMGPQRVRHDLVPSNKNNNEAGVELTSGVAVSVWPFPLHSLLLVGSIRSLVNIYFDTCWQGRYHQQEGGILLVRLIPCTTELLTSEILTNMVNRTAFLLLAGDCVCTFT